MSSDAHQRPLYQISADTWNLYGMTVSELVATVTTQGAFFTHDNMGGMM